MKKNDTGFYPADILIPNVKEPKKWSVVACDQYTSQPEYWRRVREYVGDAPSTLNLIIPEAELKDASPAEIHQNMREYVEKGVFDVYKDAFIYLKRLQSDGSVRQGLIGMLDLECYDYRPGAATLCRATEKTVEERLPPRIKVREGAILELPHVMVLIDDPDFSMIEPLENRVSDLKVLYDFDLMENGGHVTGYLLNESDNAGVTARLSALKRGENPLLYAVGDGNHSLAAAKGFYDSIKRRLGEKAQNHPARFCLIELVNVHSAALRFEPIHRVIFNVDPPRFLEEMKCFGLVPGDQNPQRVTAVYNGKKEIFSFQEETSNITLGTLQKALDQYVSEHSEAKIDYIHGEDVLESLAKQPDTVGFLLPGMKKEDLFPTVVSDGSLPRKTFSMGNAEDKRFYLECRKIN